MYSFMNYSPDPGLFSQRLKNQIIGLVDEFKN